MTELISLHCERSAPSSCVTMWCVCIHSGYFSPTVNIMEQRCLLHMVGWLALPLCVCVYVCAGRWSRHKAKVVHALVRIERVKDCIWHMHFVCRLAVNFLTVRAFWHTYGKCFDKEECLKMQSVSLPRCRLAVVFLETRATLQLYREIEGAILNGGKDVCSRACVLFTGSKKTCRCVCRAQLLPHASRGSCIASQD